MNENKEIQKLEKIKYSLREKEKMISNSQIKQNKIENQLNRLEIKINNIVNNKKNILLKILSFIVYDIIMLTIILSFLSTVINNLVLTPLLKTNIYIGLISISVAGAYISSKVEAKIEKRYHKKKLNIISSKIKEKHHEIELEINKQEIIKQEITQIINCLDNIMPETRESNYNHKKNIQYINNKEFPKIKSKTKHNKKH